MALRRLPAGAHRDPLRRGGEYVPADAGLAARLPQPYPDHEGPRRPGRLAGSNIIAVTGVGKVLSVLLAALGMMMFPIFTVYVTNLVTQRNKEAAENGKGSQIIDAFREFEQQQAALQSKDAKTAHPAPDKQ